MIDLSPAAIENVLTFLGYGNPGGVWFVGKQEGLSQMDHEDQDANLIARGRFASTMDLQTAHLTLREAGRPYDLTKRRNFTQVWVWAAKITRSLTGAADWNDVERAKDYIRSSFGRTAGRTFITNRSPIPEKGGNEDRRWQQYFAERVPNGALDALLIKRTKMLKSLIETHRPKVIICHGKPREAHRALVLNSQTAPKDSSRIESYDLPDGRHVFICPFFGVGQMTNSDAEALVGKLKDRALRL